MKRSIFAGILLFVSLTTVWAMSPKSVVIKNETDNFDLQIKYPQGFANKNIDTAVRRLIADLQKSDIPTNGHGKLSADVPGKSSLYIDYKTEFQNKNALSLLFSLSAYTRGAAHPRNRVKSFNFLNGQVVRLEQLFKPNSHYLPKIAELSRRALMKKKISDKDWIITGTKPTQDNYKNWFFTKNGLAIVFDTYQVAAYVYGPQTIEIPKVSLANWLRPEVINSVWGN